MKTKSFLAAIAFILAIGSAVASELFISDPAWTHISEVSEQTSACEQRLSCSGGSVTCQLSFEIDGKQYNNVTGYNGINPTTGNCGATLNMNP